MSNLLVVDWDFFFETPMHSQRIADQWQLYDWSMKEAPFYVSDSNLFVVYPDWHLGIEADGKPDVDLLRIHARDYQYDIDRFDYVHLCRSGAWVPSWLDSKFQDFVSQFPGKPVYVDKKLQGKLSAQCTRQFDMGEIYRSVRARKELLMGAFRTYQCIVYREY